MGKITSRFDGIVKKLYYEADDMAKVGKVSALYAKYANTAFLRAFQPLIDIDIQSEISPEDAALTQMNGNSSEAVKAAEPGSAEPPIDPSPLPSLGESPIIEDIQNTKEISEQVGVEKPLGKHATLATPAVRHLIKELNLNITDVTGTGKDGRVLKEDVTRFASAKKDTQPDSQPSLTYEPRAEDKSIPLTPIQNQMFKTMTRSLSIPHFLYTDNVDFTNLSTIRRKLNAVAAKSETQQQKVSSLAFVIKAVSLALQSYPTINAHLDTTTNPSRPQLHVRGAHDIGVAVDSPSGLLVPVIRNVQNRSILSIATEIIRLSSLARSNKLTSADLSGATFTVSNIGSIGGTAVAPVIVPPQVAILGIGKSRLVPAFDSQGQLVKKDECVFSWSADHRVLDGAVVARCAELVRLYLEDVESMAIRLR